ncbi:MAG: UDP-N-acetylglucosamine 2-epimerase (hydrolyzing) [Polyangiaceae bacterium]|nr:UDP-N-acetylglucosamine 2-epimerase (hydrolyzing) [Polyangiaceae bacterium]
MSRRRICVVVTARPSYSRIKTALLAIHEHGDLELELVVAASALIDRYGGVVRQIERDGLPVAHRVHMLVDGESPVAMAKTTGLGIIELSTVFHHLAPDFVVTVADRYETLATAVAASYQNLPLVHVQGGEVTGSIDEKVRHSITKLADAHLVASEGAAERVRRMGERPESIFVTGCPSIDLAAAVRESPALDFDVFERYGGVGAQLDLSGGYLVVLQHPVTTEHDLALEHVSATLEAVSRVGLPTLWFWPNPDAGSDGTSKGLRRYREQHRPAWLHFFRNMAPDDFLRLLLGAACLVGNSSVGIRECSFLGVPVVNIGSRQAGRERGGNVLDVPHSPGQIEAAIRDHLARPRPSEDHLYGDGRAGSRIADRLAVLTPTFEKRIAY